MGDLWVSYGRISSFLVVLLGVRLWASLFFVPLINFAIIILGNTSIKNQFVIMYDGISIIMCDDAFVLIFITVNFRNLCSF